LQYIIEVPEEIRDQMTWYWNAFVKNQDLGMTFAELLKAS
jgi:hypothetical protein